MVRVLETSDFHGSVIIRRVWLTGHTVCGHQIWTLRIRRGCWAGISNTRPANVSKLLILITFSLFWKLFLKIAAHKSFFSNKLRPAEHFCFEMWPSDGFEFETPDVEKKIEHQLLFLRSKFWGYKNKRSRWKNFSIFSMTSRIVFIIF